MPQALVAPAHQLARLIYRLLKHGQGYAAQGLEAYETAHREREVKRVGRQARARGVALVRATP